MEVNTSFKIITLHFFMMKVLYMTNLLGLKIPSLSDRLRMFQDLKSLICSLIFNYLFIGIP